MELKVLYEDNHIIVCFKPRGVLSQGGEKALDNMVDIIKRYLVNTYNKPGDAYLGLLHRLDLNVAGVMVFAKTSKAAKRLSEQIRQHKFKKYYLAIVHGRFEDSEGLYQDYLGKDEDKRQAFLADAKTGKLAELRYSVLDYDSVQDISLVSVDLKTGRFHQIRCQMSLHGHPLLGDQKYGNDVHIDDFFLGLFAYRLCLTHPVTKTKMTFNIRPEDQRFSNFKNIDKIEWRSS